MTCGALVDSFTQYALLNTKRIREQMLKESVLMSCPKDLLQAL